MSRQPICTESWVTLRQNFKLLEQVSEECTEKSGVTSGISYDYSRNCFPKRGKNLEMEWIMVMRAKRCQG